MGSHGCTHDGRRQTTNRPFSRRRTDKREGAVDGRRERVGFLITTEIVLRTPKLGEVITKETKFFAVGCVILVLGQSSKPPAGNELPRLRGRVKVEYFLVFPT